MGDRKLESLTSTMSTSEAIDEQAAICRKNDPPVEGLHHCLHLIAEASERTAASVLLDAIAETLGAEAVDRLAKTLGEQAEAIVRDDDRRQ